MACHGPDAERAYYTVTGLAAPVTRFSRNNQNEPAVAVDQNHPTCVLPRVGRPPPQGVDSPTEIGRVPR